MPHTSKRRTHLLNAIKIHWSNEGKNASSDGSSFSMDIGDENEEGANQGCQLFKSQMGYNNF